MAVVLEKSTIEPQLLKLESNENADVFSPELLGVYYSRLFPFEMIYSWLSYDPSTLMTLQSNKADMAAKKKSGSSNRIFTNREFSFTIEPFPGEEIYIRYQSFSTVDELRASIIKKNPIKIDIGAVYSHSPKDKGSIDKLKFVPNQRELIFDIDLTDYDSARLCGCSAASICNKCWKMAVFAIKVMDQGLREDFGFRHIAWFYSGRRGVHCWVADEQARQLRNEGRSAVAEYFQITQNSENNKDAGNLTYPLHPMLQRSFNVLERMFIEDILPESGHGLLSSEKNWGNLLASLPSSATTVAKTLAESWTDEGEQSSTPEEKWEELKRHLQIFVHGVPQMSKKTATMSLSPSEKTKIELWKYQTVFKYCYPRLDINVSVMQNHLLKSPFCVHPKTARVCVPISVRDVDTFDPFAVPTLTQVVKDLDENSQGCSSNEPEWKKTSLKPYFESFEKQFLLPLLKELSKEERSKREEYAAMVGEF